MFLKMIIGALLVLFVSFSPIYAQTQDPNDVPVIPQQPAGIVGALEFSDVADTPYGDTRLGQKGYVGFYYDISDRLTGIVVGEYGQNELNDVSDYVTKSVKFTCTYDLFKWEKLFHGSIFLIGSVGSTWSDITNAPNDATGFLVTSTGIGIKTPINNVHTFALHFRFDNSKEYRQFCVGIDYALPLLTKVKE